MKTKREQACGDLLVIKLFASNYARDLITMEDKQLFRKYYLFNQETFLDYLKQVKKRLENNVIMFTDRARQHQSKKVQK
jgi:hypothetical protein